jgi:glycosyltransferase involved in cell wall biosynthesis
MPVVEAMACGTPVVTSRSSSLPEVVEDAGVLVEPGDVPGLAAALARVLGDDDYRDDLRRRGLERATRFSWGEAARRTVAVYRSCS